VVLQGIVWWGLVHYFATRRIWYGFFDLSDISLYQSYAEQFARGAHLYTDVSFEYPPLAAPLMWLPKWLPPVTDYAWAFAAEMMVLCAAAAAFATATAARLARGYARALGTAIAFALVTLLAGPIAANRFDIAVGLDLAIFMYCMARRWWWAAAALLGVGFALKLMPLLLLPLVLVVAAKPWRMVRIVLTFVVTAALPFIPHVFRSGQAWMYIFRYHASRPLQIESMSSTPYLLAHALVDQQVLIGNSYGSQSLTAPGTETLASVLMGAMPATVGGLYLLVWRRRHYLRRSPSDVGLVAFGLVMTFICTNKVFSPQFLMWVFPFIALLASTPRPSRRILGGLLITAALVTQTEFPSRYWDLVALHTTPILLVAARNLILVTSALFAVVLIWLLPRQVSPRGSLALRRQP
jgi:hypothetical protein